MTPAGAAVGGWSSAGQGGSLLAHAGAVDESASVVLLFAALWIGWVGWSRMRGTGFPRLPRWAGPALLVAAGAVVVAAATVPRALFPAGGGGIDANRPLAIGASRPSSAALLEFRSPTEGTVVRDGDLEVVLGLEGGRVVETASTELSPDAGHVHVSLDGAVVSMTYGLVQVVDVRDVPPGEHTLLAEFVAADHAPFDPPVTAAVRFRTEAS
jgi:hypothetical protein